MEIELNEEKTLINNHTITQEHSLHSRISRKYSWVWNILQSNTPPDSLKTILVYGFTHCHIWQVLDAFKRAPSVCRVYDYNLGDPDGIDYIVSEEGERPIQKYPCVLEDPKYKSIARICKSALVNIVLNNYQQRLLRHDAPITPVLFCIDTNKNPFPITASHFVSLPLITYSELRRAYKLCFDEAIDPAIRKIAQETFLFAYIERTHKNGFFAYNAIPIDPPWETLDLVSAWVEKRKLKTPTNLKTESGWRNFLGTQTSTQV
jgi:hypothetical protein